MKFLQHKLSSDIAWTLGSFVILATSGILINLVVTWLRDVSSLGIFNLSYAVYIIVSQIAVFGLHYSVMRHAAFYANEHEKRHQLMFTACVVSLLLGGAAAFITYFLSPYLGMLFHSELTGKAIKYSAFGLILFPLNKVLIGYVNGIRAMKAFSILQSSRYLIVMIWVTTTSVSNISFEYITLGFLAAELITASATIAYLIKYSDFTIDLRNFSGLWVKKHFAFGGKSLLAGMFVELNSRIDVLLLGVFLSEGLVGIYSFVSMLVDGLYHMIVVVRTNFNPVLVAVVRDKKLNEAQNLLKTSKKYIYPITCFMSVAIIGSFWILATYLMPTKGLEVGMMSLMILCTCLTVISAFIPFDNLLMSIGYPGYQTAQHLCVIFANIVLNLYFVPTLGIDGAAIATGMSYFIGIAFLIIFTRRFLEWNLITNKLGINAPLNERMADS